MVRPLIWGCIGAWFATVTSGDFVSTNSRRYNQGALGHRPHLEFHSSSEYAPVLQVNTWDADNISDTGSHIFLRHDGNDSSPLSSPLILDSHDLSAVYLNRSFKNVFGTRVQENHGKKYLTFWGGEKGDGIGDGYGLAFDETYRLAYKISAQNLQVHSDLHEFAFTGNGTALVTGVDKIRARRSNLQDGWGTPERFEVLDAVFQEIDLETNEVLFDWRALDHINPMESFEPRGSGWDAYHLNSIQKTQAGNYLISIRHMHTIYLISGTTGSILWSLGGPRNNFIELPPAAGVDVSTAQPILTMGWQHHARFVPGTNETQLTFFDNHVKVTSHGTCDTDCSRGLHIAINTTASPPTVQLLREFRHPARLQAQSQGSVQPLAPQPDDLGNVFIGWGRCPSFTEHTASGETVLDVQFSPWHSPDIPDALDNYRAYKVDWSATPWWDPAIAPRKDAQGRLVVYVSWNGATEVNTWVVRGAAGDVAAAEDRKGQILVVSRRTGFETKLVVGSTEWRYLWAEAVDDRGNVLAATETVDLNTTELSVARDMYDESGTADLFDPPRPEKKRSNPGLSKVVVAVLATGVALLVLGGLAAAVVWWRRCRDYQSLEAADFDLDLGSEHEYVSDGDDEDGSDAGREGKVLQLPGVDEDSRALLPKGG
ncbi:hypothetical protein ASPACDRAFT_40763 [Aspergillus aculeatus ATCC 16872]|uniref:Arylsulfotransferase n=1 Tax=Aspergillus aculeatus (strain ATCC 16872 / CBS 172.66 / WB 5094) TaxID=690307 RepID=A0A1L9X0R9_ASPA1|nr:uncharacterized protein ASPACDRAFT_40763 [Aspergillus aculeatus ATCC 16872]OJK01946.1 hypothetical protein ASPACDRAFT_40763 [Aspergillus aculeatus ATCC 16872]